MRQLRAISALSADGFHIKVYGLSHNLFADNVYITDSLGSCTAGADVIVLPLPFSTDAPSIPDRRINAPLFDKPIYINNLTDCVGQDTIIFAGKADAEFTDLCSCKNLTVIDYANREELAVMNAIPTAEGAIEVAMSNTPFTIHGSRCLVVGYGKIGKILSSRLSSLGAKVTASARRCSDLAWIEANGFKSVHTSDLSSVADEFDIIFNTVPKVVLDFRVISKTKPDVLIIDLASKPGGVDFEVAHELGRKTISALSLPGRVAPDTAGLIIKNTLINILEELGV